MTDDLSKDKNQEHGDAAASKPADPKVNPSPRFSPKKDIDDSSAKEDVVDVVDEDSHSSTLDEDQSTLDEDQSVENNTDADADSADIAQKDSQQTFLQRFRKKNLPGKVVYPAVLAAIGVLFGVSALTGSAQSVSHATNTELSRDGLDWDAPPDSMSLAWESEGWQEVVGTPGALIGVRDNGVVRLDSETGEELWHYTRDDATVCDAANVDGQVGIVFNDGDGCSDVILLDSSTGTHLATAQYATEAESAKLIGQAGDLLLLTPNHARLLRSDLVTRSEFGKNEYLTNASDQFVGNCSISDGAVSSDGYAIAARCDDASTYSVYYLGKEPNESTRAESLLTIDTKSQNPVTIPVISKAMISFVKADDSPSVYVWELTKDQSEVTHNYIPVNSYGFEYQDIPGTGYVWRIGSEVHVRYGSEDVSQSITLDGAIGDPMTADNLLLVPQFDKVVAWDTRANTTQDIAVEGLAGTKFAFSGKTIVSYGEDGVLRGYNS